MSDKYYLTNDNYFNLESKEVKKFFIDKIMEVNPRYQFLYQIRPGITSYATLYNGYTDTMEKMLTRLDMDLYYLRNHSVLFDFRILGLTFLSIVSGKKI